MTGEIETKSEEGAQEEPRLTESQVISEYRRMLSDCQAIRRKIAELEQENSEHELVAETLETVDSSRRAYRLVGGVLVERTVGEVLPSVRQNQSNIKQILGQLGKDLDSKESDAVSWKVKFGIRTQQDAQAMSAAAPQQSTGVLA